MATTQKMYLGGVPVIKNYLGSDKISSVLGARSVVSDGLVHYFNSKETATVTEWYSSVSDRTGSYVSNVSYNPTTETINFDSSAGTPSLQFTTPSPFEGNPPPEHTVLIFMNQVAANSLSNVHWFGRSSAGNEPNSKLQLTNSSGTNYLQFQDETRGTYLASSSLGEVTTNNWHQIGYTFSGSIMNDITLHLDNNSEPISGIANTFTVTSQYWECGSEGGAGLYSGSFGAVMIYDRKLTDTEIQFNYEVLSSQFS